MLNERMVIEFKEIYLEETGEALTDQEATEKATCLLNLFKVLTGRDMEDDNED